MTTPPRKKGPGYTAAAAFVWFAWLASTVAGHLFVAKYASRVPFRDDFSMVPYLDGPVRAATWWAQHNEHRIPLPRLLIVPLIRQFQDFRVLMWLEVYVLAAVAALMIVVARKLRGHTSYFDAFFPLLWLTWGNAANLLLGHQISLILPTAIICAVLMLVLSGPSRPRLATVAGVGLCLFLLPLNGGPGVTQAPAIALWCIYAGWVAYRMVRADGAKGARATVWIAWGAVAATAVLLVVYFVGFENPNPERFNVNAGVAIMQAFKFLSMAFGPAASVYWPASGIVLGVFTAATLVMLLKVVRERPEERLRVAGVVCVAAGVLSMGIATGLARGDHPGAAFVHRYVSLPSPFLCCIYFAWVAFGSPAYARFVHVSLYSIALLLLLFNVDFGTRIGAERLAAERDFLRDLGSGQSAARLAARHAQRFGVSPETFEQKLLRLQDIGFEPVAVERLHEGEFGALGTIPSGVVADVMPSRCLVGKTEALLTHPECELYFDLPGQPTRVRGWFGIYPRSYRVGTTRGARFTIELVDPAGGPEGRPRVLWERIMRPKERPEDRGLQAFEVALPPGAGGGQLLLRSSFGPEQGDELAWACWRAIEIE